MLSFDKFTLDNGLRVIVQHDKTTPMAAVNLIYNVGAKDEDADKTGFAHLFEHLMFGGSANIPEFDKPLQDAGGTNNAFTNNDYTNYYETLPKENIETAFWLESDRMNRLAFTDKSLEVQRSVVIEEFKQRYLNQPYGDVWLLLRPLAYKVHPYQWATIGKEISHIEHATMEDVKRFFYSHYAPNNAILTVVGDVQTEDIKRLTQKWFGDIERRAVKERKLPLEPPQTQARILSVERDVPANALYKAYHMCKRTDAEFYATDLLSDVLSMGDSSRLYQHLVKEKQLFTDLDAYISGSIENGLFLFSGKLADNVSFEDAESALLSEIEQITKNPPAKNELQKVKNKLESKMKFGEMNALNNAMTLSYFELIGKAEDYNNEINKYLAVTEADILQVAQSVLRPENSSTLYYKKRS